MSVISSSSWSFNKQLLLSNCKYVVIGSLFLGHIKYHVTYFYSFPPEDPPWYPPVKLDCSSETAGSRSPHPRWVGSDPSDWSWAARPKRASPPSVCPNSVPESSPRSPGEAQERIAYLNMTGSSTKKKFKIHFCYFFHQSELWNKLVFNELLF